jgi:hypothetical protein
MGELSKLPSDRAKVRVMRFVLDHLDEYNFDQGATDAQASLCPVSEVPSPA